MRTLLSISLLLIVALLLSNCEAKIRFRRYFANRFSMPAEVIEEAEDAPAQANVPKMILTNPWIAPMVRKYRFTRLTRSDFAPDAE